MRLARRLLGGEKPVAIAAGQRLHHRVRRIEGLEQHLARPVGAAGTAGNLVEQLVGPFRRPEIAAGEAEIRIDHADQRQHRK